MESSAGGHYPVVFGDRIRDGRYMIIRNLSFGWHSREWLARDKREKKYVALKILCGDTSAKTSELQVLKLLASGASEQTDNFIPKLLDDFEIDGPNGKHTCLVLEPMGFRVKDKIDAFINPVRFSKYGVLHEDSPCKISPRERSPSNDSSSDDACVSTCPDDKPFYSPWDRATQMPPPMAKKILKESLQGLKTLQDHGLAHGDFRTHNMLFAINDLDALNRRPRRELSQPQFNHETPPLPHKPRKGNYRTKPTEMEFAWEGFSYLLLERTASLLGKSEAFEAWDREQSEKERLDEEMDLHDMDFQIKLSDMTFFFSDQPREMRLPPSLRSPELVLTGEINKTIDIWSFGCLIFELLTNRRLFDVWGPEEDILIDEHMLGMSHRLGPLPDELYQHWKTSSRYYTSERKLYNLWIGGEGPRGIKGLVIGLPPEPRTMEERFDEAEVKMSAEEANHVKALIRRILQYDVAKRPSAEEVLLDPWFAED